jgi:uncharacterized protein YndB with AHSA1/START domain
MTNANSPTSTRTSRVIKASRETIYRAFTDPAALAAWQVPGAMTGRSSLAKRWHGTSKKQLRGLRR